jgi:hypothetical protein
MNETMTWEQLAAISPGLRGLFNEAKSLRSVAARNPRFCANEIWFGKHQRGHGMKGRLCMLVGFESLDPRLKSPEAYDIAYQTIYRALPDCRACGCGDLIDYDPDEIEAGNLRRGKAPIPAELRWQVWERDNFTCQMCGARSHLAVDHIHPESKGGLLDLDNLQTLCTRCNSRKGAKVAK